MDMTKRSFFSEFLKNWKQVGSIIPSSKFLTHKMIQIIDFKKAKLIVELGGGTGIMTREILKKMSANAKLIVFEMNHQFYQMLKKIDDPRIEVMNTSASDMNKYLGKHEVDYILSGLPLSVFKKAFKTALIQVIKETLNPSGKFIQFQYTPESYLLLKDSFNKVRLRFTLLNTPPAFIYICN